VSVDPPQTPQKECGSHRKVLAEHLLNNLSHRKFVVNKQYCQCLVNRTNAGRRFAHGWHIGVESDLLHGLKAVASGHRMTAVPNHGISVPTRTQREPAAYRRNSRFLPRYRAVARSRRPHRNRCHCRVANRPRPSPPLVCWGPASHRFHSSFRHVGPQQKYSVGHPVGHNPVVFSHGVSAQPPPVRSSVPTVVGTLVTHEKAGVCARISIMFCCPHRLGTLVAV
jgi:hypothetical protein